MPRAPGQTHPEWKDLGHELRRLRELSDRSRRQVAAAVNVRSRPNATELHPMEPLYLRNIELGSSLPSQETLDSLLAALHSDRATLRSMLTSAAARRLLDPPAAQQTAGLSAPDSGEPPAATAAMTAASPQPESDGTWSTPVQSASFLSAAPSPPQPGPFPRQGEPLRLRSGSRADRQALRLRVDALVPGELRRSRSASRGGGQSLRFDSFLQTDAPGPKLAELLSYEAPATAKQADDRPEEWVPLAPAPADALAELANIYSALDNQSRHKLLGRARQLRLSSTNS